jgi:hypothetical protein
MAPLLRTYFARGQRSILSTLFTATFLGAVVVVAFPCPVRPEGIRPYARLEGSDDIASSSESRSRNQEVIVMMNGRGKRRFIEEK